MRTAQAIRNLALAQPGVRDVGRELSVYIGPADVLVTQYLDFDAGMGAAEAAAAFTTPLMKFVDDAEFWFDPAAQVIQVRSASRVGECDMGVNRKRIEGLRTALGAPP